MHIRIHLLIVISGLISNCLMGQMSRFHNSNDNCKYCHVNEFETQKSQIPHWQIREENMNYIPYSSTTFDAEIEISIGSSKVCLSCHDGVISGGHFNFNVTKENQIIGTDLSANHPISFNYNTYLARKDGDLKDPKTSPSGLGGTIDSDLLVDGRLECISCHNVHSIKQNRNLLIMSNYRSKLCLTCHDK